MGVQKTILTESLDTTPPQPKTCKAARNCFFLFWCSLFFGLLPEESPRIVFWAYSSKSLPGSFPESACEGFFVKKHLQNIYISVHLRIFTHLHLCSSSHLHIYISAHLHIVTSTSDIFTSAHLHLCSSSHPHIYISAHLHILTSTSDIFTSRSSLLSLLRPGAVPPERHETQPSAEIVRVERAKRRRDCVLDLVPATLCGDRACRGREMQARVRFGPVQRNPLRRSCASRARNAGEIAF